MKRILSALTALALAAAFFGSPRTVSASGSQKTTPSGITYDQIGSRIDGYVRKREKGLASCEVSVFDGEGVIFNGCYGCADIENGIRVDADTVYEWGRRL